MNVIYIYITFGVRKWGYYFGRSLDGLFLSFGEAQSKKKPWIWGYPHGLETSKFDVYETPDIEKLPFGLRIILYL
jgi:hypothetical protein